MDIREVQWLRERLEEKERKQKQIADIEVYLNKIRKVKGRFIINQSENTTESTHLVLSGYELCEMFEARHFILSKAVHNINQELIKYTPGTLEIVEEGGDPVEPDDEKDY